MRTRAIPLIIKDVLTDKKILLSIVLLVSALMIIKIAISFSMNPSDDRTIGYEFLNAKGEITTELSATFIHIWNNQHDYYFNKSSGIQFSNYFNESYTKNVLCVGYKPNIWQWICADVLPFKWKVMSDNSTYVNITGGITLSFSGGKQVTANMTYNLNQGDKEIKIIPYFKKTGNQYDKPVGFAWKSTDIRIGNTTELNNAEIPLTNTTSRIILLNNTVDQSFANLSMATYKLIGGGKFVRLRWDNSTDNNLTIKSESGQYNAPVTLFINFGIVTGEATTTFYWQDPSQGNYFPTSNYATSGTQLNLPTRAYLSDDLYTTGCFHANRGYGTFGFSIPSNSVINGIEVYVEGKTNTEQFCEFNDATNAFVNLSSDNGATYTSSPHTYTPFETNFDGTVTLGSPTDLWGRTWLPSDFNDGSFTLTIDIGGGTTNQYIDSISATVYYSEIIKDCTPVTNGGNWSIPCNCSIVRKSATVDFLSVNETGGTLYIDSSNISYRNLNITPTQCSIYMNGTFQFFWKGN